MTIYDKIKYAALAQSDSIKAGKILNSKLYKFNAS